MRNTRQNNYIKFKYKKNAKFQRIICIVDPRRDVNENKELYFIFNKMTVLEKNYIFKQCLIRTKGIN